MAYILEIKNKAQNEIKNLNKRIRTRVVQEIYKLKDEPRPRGCKKLKGELRNCYRKRIGKYRILYKINDNERLIIILRVRLREDVYKD